MSEDVEDTAAVAADASAPDPVPEAAGGPPALAEVAQATVVASANSETPAPSAAVRGRFDDLVDHWFGVVIVGSDAASQHWNFLVMARENLKELLNSNI
jgi:hypothetical protein